MEQTIKHTSFHLMWYGTEMRMTKKNICIRVYTCMDANSVQT